MKALVFLALVPSLAFGATARLSTGQSCTYTGATTDSAGNFTFTCSGTAPPPTPPAPPAPPAPPPPTGCPAPQPHQVVNLGWSSTALELRLPSGYIASFPIPAPNSAKASVQLAQGQQQASPVDGFSEMSISKCPGVIDTSNASCYSKQPNGLNFTSSKDAYTKPVHGFNSQATLGYRGCWAPASEGQWYVNVRWTYSGACFGQACGYAMQWLPGAY
jgi:hypothetical protein